MWLLGMWRIFALVWGVIVYLVLLVVVAVSAGNRGRNGVVWGIWAILFSPPLAGFMLICLGEWKPSEKREVKAAPVKAAPSQVLLADEEIGDWLKGRLSDHPENDPQRR
jgi:H+/Cl- antiporter ClcA